MNQASQQERYAQAWHLFIGADGELSTDRAASRVTVGATFTGRVRVTVPDGMAIAPDAAEKIAGRITEAARIARNPDARFDTEGEAQS